MAGKYLLGAAGAALLALASTGAARAADVMPIVVPVVTPVVPVAVGPTVEITAEQWLEAFVYPGLGYDVIEYGEVDLKVTAASGWGFQLNVNQEAEFELPVEVEANVTGRVFRKAGDLELGVYAGFGFGFPGGIGGYGFGFDFAYDTARLTLESFTQFNFGGGAFIFMDAEAQATVHLDPLDLYAGVGVETDFGGMPLIELWAGAEYTLGVVTPRVELFWGNFYGFGAELGVDLEYQIGDGPLSLLGYAEATLYFPGTEYAAGVGIRYKLGGE